MNIFWKRFEELRKTLELTQREVSIRSGFSKTKVENWLVRNPQPIPKGDDCVALAKTLGTSVEYLVTGEENYDEKTDIVGKASGIPLAEDPVLKIIIDDPNLYRVAQLIVEDRKKALAVLALAGEYPVKPQTTMNASPKNKIPV